MNQSIPIINHFTALVKVSGFKNDSRIIEKIANDLINGLKLNIVKKNVYSFKPIGKTLIYILSESHLAIHTWPEYEVLHFDLVSCKEIKEKDFTKVLEESFKAFGKSVSFLKICKI
jgi:S-adenosylmethionine decarboxylase